MGMLGWRRGRFVIVVYGGRGARLFGLLVGLFVGGLAVLLVDFVRRGLAFESGFWLGVAVAAFAAFAGAGCAWPWPQGGVSIAERSWGCWG